MNVQKSSHWKARSGERKQAIAFSVGFEYERPDVAARVANELVTMILNEDVRTRTNFASETTKFLESDVKRLENQLSAINDEINNRQKTATGGLFDPADDGRNLAALKAQLAVKSANFSDSHPDVRALKRQIKALEDTSSLRKKQHHLPSRQAKMSLPEIQTRWE